MSDSDYINYQKLIIFGSEKVGKTTLINLLKSNQNNLDNSNSSQDSISFEKAYIKINENVFNFIIYEIKINEQNDSQSTNLNTLLLDCQGIIYLIDNTVNSFECMKNLINLLNFKEKTYSKQILIKNKSDLIFNDNISNETINNFISSKENISFIEVSLQNKTNFNQIQNFITNSFSKEKNPIPSNNILENSNIANTQKLSIEGNSIKLLLLGDTSVGKSSFINRYFKNFFQEEFLSTIGLDSQSKIIKIFDENYKLTIWDTAGQERFRSITRNYYKNADGVFLIYDVNDSENYDNITKWVNDIKENNTSVDNKITIFLLGNKIDLNQRKIDYARAEQMAKTLEVKYFEISCKLNININEVVDRMVLEVYQKSNNPKGQSLESNKKKENSGCCGGNKKKK
jgi:Rab family protein